MHLASMKVFAIPELLECIAQVLETKDQLHLSKANRLCYQAVSPLFWSALDLSEKTRAERLFESTHHHDGLCRNFHRVRHLKIQTEALLHLVGSMTQPDNSNSDAVNNQSSPNNPDTELVTLIASESVLNWLPKSPLWNPLTVALPRMTQLVSLEYSTEVKIGATSTSIMDAYPDIPIFPALTWTILCNQSSLSHLHLTKCRIKSSTDVLLLIQCISTLSALQHLSAEFEETAILWGDVVQEFFDSLPTSSLEDLTLTLSSDGHENRAATPLLIHRSNNQGGAETPGSVGTGGLSSPLVAKRRLPLLSRLKRLRIDVRLRRDVRMLAFFLARCPTLELFFPPQACVKPCQGALILISRAIYKHCRRLHVLENGGCATARILTILPINTLTTLCNDGYWSEEDMTMVVHLVSRRQFNSLTEIRITNGLHIKGTHIQAILWSCSVLEHLTIKHQNIAATRLKHLVEKDWACTRLKTLEMTVDLRRVRTLACKLSQAGRPMPTVDKNTWMMLRKFYRQLGALTGIEVLNLGIYSKELWWMDSEGRIRDKGEFVATELDRDDDGTWDLADDVTTELTIDDRRTHFAIMPDASFPGLLSLGDESSGRPGYLSWLSGLTNLRELRGHVQATTSETSRTLGQRELEWMIEHWPSLKVIELLPAFDEYGWYRNQVDLSPPHIVWFRKQRPDICIQQS